MGEIAVRQAVLHGLVAAGFVAAVLRGWRIRRPGTRLAFWALALAFPLLVLPSFLLLAPVRGTDRFGAAAALFSSARWKGVQVAGIGADAVVFGALVLLGVLLLLRDVVPFLVGLWRDRREARTPRAETPAAVTELVAELAGRVRTAPPTVIVVHADASILLVRGLLHPVLILSDAVTARLSPAALRAALAHELAHVRFKDTVAGWALMAARLAMFWNPAVQLIGRAIGHEMESRADRAAADVTSAEAVAGALRTLAAPEAGRTRRDPRARLELLAGRLYRAHIAARLAAVLAPVPPVPLAKTRLAATAATLGALLFFVV